MTALMLAAEAGHADSVQLLLVHKADPNIQNADEYTALLLAAEAGHDEVARIICQFLQESQTKREDGIDKQNKFGKTALIMAAEFNKLNVLKVLVSYGANVNHSSKRGQTALKLAAVKRNQDVVEYLCSLNPNTKGASLAYFSWLIC
jgi:ankyrin repeat protein